MELIYILTYDCNFRCKYCDIHKRKESITLDTIKQSLEFLNRWNFSIEKVKFFWGEPLIKRDFIKYIIHNFPKKYFPQFYVTTNATLVDDDFMLFAKENNLIITFSIDWDIETTAKNRVLQNGENSAIKVIENTRKYSGDIRINQVITSQTAPLFFDNFKFIYDLWVRKFNFLPEYYSEWTKAWLKNLKLWFDKIRSFYNDWNNFHLVNLENYSEIAFFNFWLVVDTDWKIYWTNLVLSWVFEKYKKELQIWNLDSELFFDIYDEEFQKWYFSLIWKLIKKEYSTELLSVKYVDLILSNFCEKWTIKD